MTSPAPQPSFENYEAAVAAVRAKLAAYAALVWATVGFTDADMDRLVASIVPKVLSGQLLVANLTAAYFARVTGAEQAPVVEAAVTQGRGVPPELVYQRPIITTRAKIAEGLSVFDARAAGARRLESLVVTDLQMAKVRQADASLRHAGVQHYRRVPKGGHTCARCLIASTRRYRVGTLSPIHPGCDCGVDVIPPGTDLVLDEQLLERTHEMVAKFVGAADRSGRDVNYLDLIVTRQHGEIGPVIAWRGQHFTGPRDVGAVANDLLVNP